MIRWENSHFFKFSKTNSLWCHGIRSCIRWKQYHLPFLLYFFLPLFVCLFCFVFLSMVPSETKPKYSKLHRVKRCTNIKWRVAPHPKVLTSRIDEQWQHVDLCKGLTEKPTRCGLWTNLSGSWHQCHVSFSAIYHFHRHMAMMELLVQTLERTSPEQCASVKDGWACFTQAVLFFFFKETE